MERTRRDNKPREIETDLTLVLKKPQHYHVTVFAYQSVTPEGTFQWSTEFTLVCNDVPLAVDRAKRLSDKKETHIGKVVQCSDPQHMENL